MRRLVLQAVAISSFAVGQQIGSIKEEHPTLLTQTCTNAEGCKPHETKLVIDALSHHIVDIDTGYPCIRPKSGALNKNICPTVAECGQNCALEGTNYHNHGVETHGDAVTLHMYVKSGNELRSASPRLYLLNEDLEEYTMLKLLGQELSFDVDMSRLPCGMNSALYLSEMEADGGRSASNPAGATYGTGYCDAQCYNTSAFINGEANVHTLGACCNEMDIWEANARATALTPHSCSKPGFYECSGSECDEDGICDKSGCSFNPYLLGAKQYYGLNKMVNTLKPMTVTTQFVTDDSTTSGTLQEIRRLYVQEGKIIQNAVVKYQKSTLDSITEPYCNAASESFVERGGLATMGGALGRGMVLIFSIWNDAGAFMNWLDAGDAGPCNDKQGRPGIIKNAAPGKISLSTLAYRAQLIVLDDITGTRVTFSNIKWGDIGSTYTASA
jgi:cellulase